MKLSAISFLQENLTDKSITVVFIGNNRWLKRQIKTKLSETYGDAKQYSYEEDAKEVADIVTSNSLFGSQKTYCHTLCQDAEITSKWLTKLELVPKYICLGIEHEEKKTDKRIYQSQAKAYVKFENRKDVYIIDVLDPADNVCKTIIGRILAAHDQNEGDLAARFFVEYGSDFEAVEENAKKLALSDNPAILDKKDIEVKESWKIIDQWVKGDLQTSLRLLAAIEKNNSNAYQVSLYLCRQLRMYVIARAAGRGYPALLEKARTRPMTWFEHSYCSLLKLNPLSKSYYDELKMLICSTFMQ